MRRGLAVLATAMVLGFGGLAAGASATHHAGSSRPPLVSPSPTPSDESPFAAPPPSSTPAPSNPIVTTGAS